MFGGMSQIGGSLGEAEKMASKAKEEAAAQSKKMQEMAKEQAAGLKERANEAMDKAKGMVGTLPRNETEGIIFVMQKMKKDQMRELLLSEDIDIPVERLDEICKDLKPEAIEKILADSETLFGQVKKFDSFLKDPSIEVLAEDKGMKNLVFKVMKDDKNPMFKAMAKANPGKEVKGMVGTMNMGINLYVFDKKRPYLKFIFIAFIVALLAVYVYFLVQYFNK